MSTLSEPLVPVLAVVGIGLIGGSFAAALRRAGQVGRVLGVGRSQASIDHAQALGLIDEAVTLEQAAQRADLVLLATPVGAMGPALRSMAPYLSPHVLVTDAGSTKADVADMARDILGERCAQFVPGHPIAGSEMTGPQAADALLFQGRNVILTPFDQTPASMRAWLTKVWEVCGARVIAMNPATHDRALASVSHVPHFLAAAYMAQVSRASNADLRLSLAGTGFRDFTRIAAGSPEVWRDIFLSNREAVLQEIEQFGVVLEDLRQTLEHADAHALEEVLEQAALARRFWGSRSGLT
ncbi:prephenate dehydrogenase/arogenate dehydrogenase family protein [Alcaligenaceae bacterium CGII-47]|nr:prephenate dehydrogenase/arogenate dehydrogenase family protein [Alcaligenaceae bacterium CGII-47]